MPVRVHNLRSIPRASLPLDIHSSCMSPSSPSSLVQHSHPPFPHLPTIPNHPTTLTAHVPNCKATLPSTTACPSPPTASLLPQILTHRRRDTAKLISLLPSCMTDCQIRVNCVDGCAYDDMPCHCANHDAYAAVRLSLYPFPSHLFRYQPFLTPTEIMSPCALPKDKDGNGTCTFPELSTSVRPVVNEMCASFNATTYWAYHGCPQKLSRG